MTGKSGAVVNYSDQMSIVHRLGCWGASGVVSFGKWRLHIGYRALALAALVGDGSTLLDESCKSGLQLVIAVR